MGTKVTIQGATNKAILLMQEMRIPGAAIDTRLTEGASLTVRRSFTVDGHISVRYEMGYDASKPRKMHCKPHVETNFGSAIRGGVEMVAFAQLVRELTDAAVQIQLMLDQLEIGGEA